MNGSGVFGRIASALDRGCAAIDRVVKGSLVVFMGAILALLMLQVVMRYIVRMPLAWVEELTSFTLAYLVLWGCSTCLRAGMHVRVDTFADLLPARLRSALAVAIHVLIIYFCYLMVTAGHTLAQLGAGDLSYSGTFNLYWPRLAIVSGGVLIGLQAANNAVQILAGAESNEPAGRPV